MSEFENLNIARISELPSPGTIKSELPLSEKAAASVKSGRQAVSDIINGKDKRLMIITGPCSIHQEEIALDYAKKLAELQKELPQFCIVMRVYFEKPRTTVGWKGLVNDPHLNDTYDIEAGIRLGRKILMEIAELGLATATEFLDPIVPQYIADTVSWAAIGARTTESQTHREMASGLSMPVGFKNGTDGSVEVALNAIQSSYSPQNFLGISQDGKSSIVSTTGNKLGHLVLRGGGGKPNYSKEDVASAVAAMEKRGINPVVVVDCSHANSNKDHERQPIVLNDVIDQIAAGNENLRGVMLESNIGPGNQSIPKDLSELVYGVSVTDKCIDWDTTVQILKDAHGRFAAN
jgi:3-deoxy-7-phosphoheptulonate synthase